MFEGRGTCQFLGVPFSKKCRNYRYQFLKYVQTKGTIFEKYCKIIRREIDY